MLFLFSSLHYLRMVNGFCNRSRPVAVLLVVLLANAQLRTVAHDSSLSVSAVQSSSSCCSLGRLESRLTKMDHQLNNIQRTTESLKDPLLNEHCEVEMLSYGYNDSTRYGHVKTTGGSRTLLLDERGSYSEKDRGVSLFELDATTCTTRNRQTFDTYDFPDERVQLLEALESAAPGKIIVGVSTDCSENRDDVSFKNVVRPFFTRYNMNISSVQYRDKFAFVMQKAYPKKSVFQRKARYGANLRMKILLTGSTATDVTFKLL